MIGWRWAERDLGFRFRAGTGKRQTEHYQGGRPGEFYVVPASQRKLSKEQVERFAEFAPAPAGARIVPNPWQNYNRDWDWVWTDDGIALNWAGCLDVEEIHRREDEGVQRAMDLAAGFVQRADAVPLNNHVLRQIHLALLGAIYPFAGQWRTVSLHKGEGATKWPLPPHGIQPVMDDFETKVLARSPLLSDDDAEIFAYAAEVMGEFIAIHPFREGNGRTAFILGNLILMQNNMLPLTTYERREDEALYLAACERSRIHADYKPLADLLRRWQDSAIARWEAGHE